MRVFQFFCGDQVLWVAAEYPEIARGHVNPEWLSMSEVVTADTIAATCAEDLFNLGVDIVLPRKD